MNHQELIEALHQDGLLLAQAIKKVEAGELDGMEEVEKWLESVGYNKKRSDDNQIRALHIADQIETENSKRSR